MYSLSPVGERLIKGDEGLRLHAYYCPAGKLTIGYGHRVLPGEPLVITPAEAEKYFLQDTSKALAVLWGEVQTLRQNQVDALCSFIYNCGIAAWRGSSALKDLIAGRVSEVPGELERWVHDDHDNVIPGLVSRRRQEANLFIGAQAA